MYCLKTKNNWPPEAHILNLEMLPGKEELIELSKAFEQGIYEGLVILNKNIQYKKSPTYSTIDLEILNYFSNIRLISIIGYYFSDIGPILKYKNDLIYLSIDVSKCRNPELLNEFVNLKGLRLGCKKGWIGEAIITPNAEELDCSNNTDFRIFDFKKAFKLFYIRFGGNLKTIEHSNLGSAPNVRILDFMFVRNLGEFDFISSMHSLNYISFIWAPKLEAIPDISKLDQLKMISLDTCARLRDLSAIADNHSIESLYINKIQDIEVLKPLVNHPSLKFICASFKSNKLREQAKELLGDRLKDTIQRLPTYTIGPNDLQVEYRD